MNNKKWEPEAKYLIVNADDFGLSEGINKAIAQAHDFGILTSATILANMPATGQVAELCRDNPGLGVGVHLNFIRGKPLAEPERIKSLLNNQGRFVQKTGVFLRRLFLGKIKREELEEELSAQVRKVMDLGITPTHLDSENNLHLLPPVTEALISVADKFKIKAVRLTNEMALTRIIRRKSNWFNPQFRKMRFWTMCSSLARLKVENAGLRFADYFWGIRDSGQMNGAAYKALLPGLPVGVTEIMTHPGFVDDEPGNFSQNIGGYDINKKREDEFHGLVAPGLKEIIRKRNITLINYRDLCELKKRSSHE